MLLQQKADAVDISGDRLVLVLHHCGKVELRLARDNAECGKLMRGLGEFIRRMQQRLRRDAADVEASAAMRLALFDDGNL